jgi:hypothetical protein
MPVSARKASRRNRVLKPHSCFGYAYSCASTSTSCGRNGYGPREQMQPAISHSSCDSSVTSAPYLPGCPRGLPDPFFPSLATGSPSSVYMPSPAQARAACSRSLLAAFPRATIEPALYTPLHSLVPCAFGRRLVLRPLIPRQTLSGSSEYCATGPLMVDSYY